MSKVFKYALVARGSTPLAEYPLDDPDTHEMAMQILAKLDLSTPFSVVERQHVLFTASTNKDGMSFICMCDKSVETRRVGQFLSNLKSKWMQCYGLSSTSIEKNEKDEEFEPHFVELLNHYNELVPPPPPPEPQPEKAAEADAPLVDQMDVAENPFSISTLADTSVHHPEIPDGFHSDPVDESLGKLRVRIWCGRYKWYIICFFGLFVWLYIICAFYCNDITLGKCLRP